MIFVLVVLVIGFSGLVAQALLLRELLVSFYGNELTIGIILANWMLSESAGAFLSGRYIERFKNKSNIFVILQIIFSLGAIFSIYLARVVKVWLGILPGEAVGLGIIFWGSFLVILLVGFCHGALFSCICKLHSLYFKQDYFSIGKVYIWETLGSLLAGIIFTYLFIQHLHSFQIVFIISLLNLIICWIWFRFLFPQTIIVLKWITFFLVFIILFLYFSGNINSLHRLSIERQWEKHNVLDYRNSIYGNIVVTQRENQYTFFYNGLPVITTPYPDITFVQEFANLPLLFHRSPKDVAIIGAGAGGLIYEVLKHPIRHLDYAELDPLIIEEIKRYPTDLTLQEFADPRIEVINTDGRFFVRTTPHRYDVVLIGLPYPSDLSTNRLFTKEFFLLVKNKLNPQGIIALWLPGSLTYLEQGIKDLNACITNALNVTFSYVHTIPGDYNIFLASDSQDILEVNPKLIIQRINQRQIRKVDILVPNYLEYRLHPRWLMWFRQALLKDSTRKVNQDFIPFAVFETLVIWNKKFSDFIPKIFLDLKELKLGNIAVVIFILTAILSIIMLRRKSLQLAVAYGIATTGFFGMLINLILIFAFQVCYGYLYHKIAMLVSIFMGGIALGSSIMSYYLKKVRRYEAGLNLFILLEAMIMFLSLFCGLLIVYIDKEIILVAILILLFLLSGLLVGLEFPLAGKIYFKKTESVGLTAGVIYFFDLIGGWLAGILGGTLLIPVLGLLNVCLVMVILKLSSLVILSLRMYLIPD
ncbi:MAG: spermine synthase [Candidatus Omnitrophica bacterium]|nr:spermine synthase [Candidatus Omnitrophota bacterium]